MAEDSRGAVLRRSIETCIRSTPEAVADLGSVFTDDVTMWSPNILAVGLTDLAESLEFRELALSDVDLEFSSVGVVGTRGFSEFRVTAMFTGPFVMDDDVVIEPNGRQLLLGAAAIADFEGDKVKAMRVYFDDMSLLEQMLDNGA